MNTTISQNWQDFATQSLPKDINGEALTAVKFAFYAGALTTIDMQVQVIG